MQSSYSYSRSTFCSRQHRLQVSMRLLAQQCASARARPLTTLGRRLALRRQRTAVSQAKAPFVAERVSEEVAVATSSDQGVPGWQQLVALNALVAVICSVDRAAISVTILPMSAEFLWDDSTKGLISSAFFIGYVFMLCELCHLLSNLRNTSRMHAPRSSTFTCCQSAFAS